MRFGGRERNSKLSNRVVVITAGSSGIGKATAELFARDGEHVVILNRSEKAGEETEAELIAGGGSALFIKTDIGVAKEVDAAFLAAAERFGRIDILFANAAIQINKPIYEPTEEDWDTMMAANLKGTFLCCKAAATYMDEATQRQRCDLLVGARVQFVSGVHGIRDNQRRAE
jgi:NAD(P)-dependent dehydrogenase (short-subunit alcohol dehydrogenase family)